MAAPFSVCTKEEQSAVVRFLWAAGVPGAELHSRLSAQYGNNAALRRSVYEWITMLNDSGVTDEDQSGRPPSSTSEANRIQRVRAMILLNRRAATNEVTRHGAHHLWFCAWNHSRPC
jgi:hypothetical protein